MLCNSVTLLYFCVYFITGIVSVYSSYYQFFDISASIEQLGKSV